MKIQQIYLSLVTVLLMFSEISAQKLVENFEMPIPIAIAETNAIKVDDQNRILVAGDIDFYEEMEKLNMVRLNADGTLDETFNFTSEVSLRQIELLSTGEIIAISLNYMYKINDSGAIIGYTEIGYFSSIKVKNDKILVVSTAEGLKRYDDDLNLDATFNNSNVFSDGNVYAVAFQGDNILVGGTFSKVNGIDRNDIARFDENGDFDQSFDVGAGTDDSIGALIVQDDGKIILGETFINSFNGIYQNGITRLNSDGSLDSDFDPPSLNGGTRDLVVQDGKILFAAAYYDGVSTKDRLMRLNEDGSIDGAFSVVIRDTWEIELMSDNSILICPKGINKSLEKFSSDGTLVDEFHPPLYKAGFFNNAAYYNDFIIVTGDFVKLNNVETLQIGKINLNGDVDPGFMIGGDINPANYLPVDIYIKGDEEIYVSLGYKIVKLNGQGNPAADFSTPESVTRPSGIADDPNFAHYFEFYQNGQIATAGPNGVYLLNHNGSQDTGFIFENTSMMNSNYFGFGMQTTGNILYGSFFNEINNVAVNRLVRLTPGGSIDGSFDMGSGPGETVSYINILPNDEIIVGVDNFNDVNSNMGIVKLDVDGALNTGFVENLNSTFTEPFYFHDGISYKDSTFLFSYVNYWTYEQSISRVDIDGNVFSNFSLPDGITVQKYVGDGFLQPIAVGEDKFLLLGDFLIEDSGAREKGLLIAHNEAPVIVSVQSSISTAEETPVLISVNDLIIEDVDNIFPEDFYLSLIEGPNYTVNNNEVIPDKDFNGTLTVPLIVSDGHADSEIFELSVQVNPVNDIPVVTGAISTFSSTNGIPVVISPADLTVEDPDSSFPEDFSLTILDGENYSIINNAVVPDEGFGGKLAASLIVNDGIDNSEPYIVDIDVIRITGIDSDNLNQNIVAYPNPAGNQLNISTDDSIEFFHLTIINAKGEVVYSVDNQRSINVNALSKGMYILQVRSNEKVQSMKFMKE